MRKVQMPQSDAPHQGPHISAAILAWLLPGLGHIVLGHKRRGILVMCGALFLICCGTLVGGIDVVDHQQDWLWFVAQVFCGPLVIAIDLLNQSVIAALPISERATCVGLSHVNEIGTLFVAMAGLMNFVVILDTLYLVPNLDLERRAGVES